jgi:AAHS family 4-hydroxybenzoate transporter-like MFS transporter
VLDEAQWSLFQKKVLLLVSLIIVLDGLDTQTLTLAIPSITREWGIGRAPFGIILAFGFVAMAIGTALGGLMGDRLGRRGALLGSTAIFGLGTLAGAATHDVWWLGATRIIASVGLGAAMPNATALVAEYTPRRWRSLALGIAMGSVPIGAFAGGMLAAYILPLGSWKLLFVVCGAIPLAGALFLAAVLPESIRFLVARGGAGKRIAELLTKIGHPVPAAATFVDSGEDRPSRAQIGELFGQLYRRDTLVLSGAFFLIIFSNLFILSWTPSLLADLGYGAGVTSAGAATVSIGGLFGAIGGAALFATIGSRRSLTLMTGGAIATVVGISLLPIGPGGIGAAWLFSLLLTTGIFIPGSQVMLFSLAGQAYPTAIRATGVGFVAAVGRCGAVASGLSGPFLLPTGPFGFFTAVAFAMTASALLLLFTRTVLPPSLVRSGRKMRPDMLA